MSRRTDYGRLLTAFADRKTKSENAGKARADIRLPSWERLLLIDARAETAASCTRIKQAVFPWDETNGNTSGTADVTGERQGCP